MKQRITTFLAGGLLALTLFGVAVAGQLEDGIAAYRQLDYATAWRLIRPLAEQGDAVAQEWLGSMYDRGRGVPEDPKQAAAWYLKAADQGDALALFHLGLMYEVGRGVPKDRGQAAAWYLKAADQGNTDAQNTLVILYVNGEAVPQNYAHVFPWVRRSADEGDAPAQLMLGLMYVEGRGVPQNNAQAHMWLNLAGARAQDDWTRNKAVNGRDLVAKAMTPDQIAEAQRMAREWKPK